VLTLPAEADAERITVAVGAVMAALQGAAFTLSMASKVRIFLCRSPINMRKGFDGLHGVVLEVLRRDPLWAIFLSFSTSVAIA
jgi:hypothetical protein